LAGGESFQGRSSAGIPPLKNQYKWGRKNLCDVVLLT
jgi:hypothetical protein